MDFSMVSPHSAAIQGSPTLGAAAAAKAAQAANPNYANLTPGAPFETTPPEILEVQTQFAAVARKGYPAASGAYARAPLAHYTNTHFGTAYGEGNVYPTQGAKEALPEVLRAIMGLGSNQAVATFTPYWPSYSQMAHEVGARFSALPEFMDPAALAVAIKEEGIRTLIITSPNNPTGKVIPRDLQLAYAQVARDNNVVIVNDEVYKRVIGPGVQVTTLAAEGFADSVVNVYSWSKDLGLPDQRLGWVTGPEDLIGNLARRRSQLIGGGAFERLDLMKYLAENTGGVTERIIAENVARYQERAQAYVEAFGNTAGISYQRPDGAIYFWIGVEAFNGATSPVGVHIASEDDLQRVLSEEYEVGVVPGGAFGDPWHYRLSMARPVDEIQRGAARIVQAAQDMVGG